MNCKCLITVPRQIKTDFATTAVVDTIVQKGSHLIPIGITIRNILNDTIQRGVVYANYCPFCGTKTTLNNQSNETKNQFPVLPK